MAKLTDQFVRSLEPPAKGNRIVYEKRREHAHAVTGFGIRVTAAGARSFVLRYVFDGREYRATIGPYPSWSVEAARREAQRLRATIDLGQSHPMAERVANQMAERDTVAALVEQFSARHLSKLKSGDHARRFLDRFVVPAWGERDVHDITRRDVIDLLDEIADSGRLTTANRVLAHARKFFNWCVERDVLQVAPTMGVKPPAKETARDRFLNEDEIRWFWRACDRANEPWGKVGKILLLTGQRLGEVVEMTADEIEGDLWRLSAARTKNGRAHDVPLSEPAGAILRAAEPAGGGPGYLFSTTGTTPVSGFHRARNAIAEHMADVAAEERGRRVEIPRWTFHDLRRTAATGMARLGIPVRVTEAVLNHVSGTGGGIVAVYQRHDYAPEKREALEAWAAHIETLVAADGVKVLR